MIGTLIGLLFLAVLAGFVWWACQQLLALVPIAEPFRTIVRIIVAGLILVVVYYAVVMLLGLAGVHVSMPRLH